MLGRAKGGIADLWQFEFEGLRGELFGGQLERASWVNWHRKRDAAEMKDAGD